jgi:hypothetical protein
VSLMADLPPPSGSNEQQLGTGIILCQGKNVLNCLFLPGVWNESKDTLHRLTGPDGWENGRAVLVDCCVAKMAVVTRQKGRCEC